MNTFLEVAFILEELEKKFKIKVYKFIYENGVLVAKTNVGVDYKIKVEENGNENIL